MIIFWHHVGREHGENGYAPDIKKNSSDVVGKTLSNKIEFAKKSKNRFLKYDEDTLLELPSKDSEDKFIVIYCISKGLQFSLGLKKSYPYWLIDIVNIEEIENDVYCVHDLFIDISLQKDGQYEILDLDDFHFAFENGILDMELTSKTLLSLSNIVSELNNSLFPNEFIKQIVEKYM